MRPHNKLLLLALTLIAFFCLTGAQREMPTVKLDAMMLVEVDGSELRFTGRDGNPINSKGKQIGSITFGEKRTINVQITIREP